jgi:hypothetical protein
MKQHFLSGLLIREAYNMNLSKERPDALANLDYTKPFYSNNSANQRARILKHFAISPRLSTIEAREVHGILHPCGRIMELRNLGYRIDTHWITAPDSNGVAHRIGLYVFHGLKKRGSS